MAYSEEEKTKIFDNICEIIINGKSLRTALKSSKVKIDVSTFFVWLREDEIKSKQYARATIERAELMFEDMCDIADQEPRLTKTKFGMAVDGGDVQHKKLMVDTRKFAISKMMPKKYGNTPDIIDNSDNEITIKIV